MWPPAGLTRYGLLWWTWWLGDGTGDLLVAPLLLTLSSWTRVNRHSPSYLHRVRTVLAGRGIQHEDSQRPGPRVRARPHIVEVHGGEVEARSEGEGRGSTFLIRLPGRTQEPGQDAATM